MKPPETDCRACKPILQTKLSGGGDELCAVNQQCGVLSLHLGGSLCAIYPATIAKVHGNIVAFFRMEGRKMRRR